MKILHVVQGYPPAAGGTEQAFAHLSESLVKLFGDEVTVFTTNCYGGDAFNRFGLPAMPAGEEKINGVSVRRFKVMRWVSWLARLPQKIAWELKLPGRQYLQTLYQGPLMPGLGRAIRRSDASLVVASAFPLMHMYQATRAAVRSGKKLVLVGGLHPDDHWSFQRPMITRAYQQADACIAYTQYEAEYLRGLGIRPERIHVVALGVDVQAQPIQNAKEIRQRLGLGPAPVVGFIGQISPHKGVELLIQAMQVVWRTHPEVQLLVAGAKRPFAQKIETMLAGIPGSQQSLVALHYDFADDEKTDLFQALDVFAYPSRYESFGISFLEAWQAHKPVVGLKAGAVPCVVDDGRNGLLTEPGDALALAGALIRLIENPGLAASLAESGYQDVQVKYSWPAITQQFREVYTHATNLKDGNGNVA